MAGQGEKNGFFFLKGLSAGLEVFPLVYEPSEDSFLLAESVEIEKGCCRKADFSPGFLQQQKGCSVLDLGTGTGIQGISAALKGAARVLCTDVNENALENAKRNAEKAGFLKGFEFRQGSLFECIGKGEKFDVIIFNPPYVPSRGKKFVDLDGGKKGRETLDCFLSGFGCHLKEGGKCFFLQSSANGEKETVKALKRLGFECRPVSRKRIFFEELIVFKAWKKP